MTTLQLVGIIALVLVLIIGIGLKVYTKKALEDIDGLDETVIGEAEEVYGSINREQL